MSDSEGEAEPVAPRPTQRVRKADKAILLAERHQEVEPQVNAYSIADSAKATIRRPYVHTYTIIWKHGIMAVT